VLIALRGLDAAREPYESEVLVFDSGERLLAAAAVFWTSTSVGFSGAGGDGVVGEPHPEPARCP
jgi:hypothetical protein